MCGQKWQWKVNEQGWVNWPDYQWRIWKNIKRIKWKNKVHEVLEGHKTIDDYNDYVYEMVQDFRDFTIMHYRYATRSDTKFWQDQKGKPIPAKQNIIE